MLASFVIIHPFSCGDFPSRGFSQPCVSTLIQVPQTRQSFFGKNFLVRATNIAKDGTKKSRRWRTLRTAHETSRHFNSVFSNTRHLTMLWIPF
jgi:hypothetical protein